MIKNIERNILLKRLTGNLGKVIEEEDRIVCYIDKYFVNNFKVNLTRNYVNKVISKPIYYVIDGMEVNSELNVFCRDVYLLVKNSIINGNIVLESNSMLEIGGSCFNGKTNICSDSLIVRNSSFRYLEDVYVSSLSFYNTSVQSEGIDISVTGKSLIDSSTIMSKSYLSIESDSIFSDNSYLCCDSIIYIISNNISSLNVSSNLLAVNKENIGSGNIVIDGCFLEESNERKLI